MTETELFDSIRRLQHLEGWCDLPKAEALARMVIEVKPTVSVEIGVFAGKSFLPIALAHKYIGFGIAVGIDPWDMEELVQDQTSEDYKKAWREKDLRKVFYGFMDSLGEEGVKDFSLIIPRKSLHAIPPTQIGLLHIDGSHNETAISDVERFAPNVTLNGYVVLDDLDWGLPGKPVRKAEARLLAMGFVKQYDLHSGAAYKRPQNQTA